MLDDRTLVTIAGVIAAYLAGVVTNVIKDRRVSVDTAATEDRRAIRELQSSLVQNAYAEVARVQTELARVTAERDRAMTLLWQAIPSAEQAASLLKQVTHKDASS